MSKISKSGQGQHSVYSVVLLVIVLYTVHSAECTVHVRAHTVELADKHTNIFTAVGLYLLKSFVIKTHLVAKLFCRHVVPLRLTTDVDILVCQGFLARTSFPIELTFGKSPKSSQVSDFGTKGDKSW